MVKTNTDTLWMTAITLKIHHESAMLARWTVVVVTTSTSIFKTVMIDLRVSVAYYVPDNFEGRLCFTV